VTFEAIRKWCRKFGPLYANQRRRPRPGDQWHLDEGSLTIHGNRHDRWRAVDQDGQVLAILVPRRQDKKIARQVFRKLLKGLTYVARVIIMDRLKSHGAAKREIFSEGNIASIAISTIARRIRTNPRISGSGGGTSLSHWDRPSDPSPRMV
jgi:transposase-like protein